MAALGCLVGHNSMSDRTCVLVVKASVFLSFESFDGSVELPMPALLSLTPQVRSIINCSFYMFGEGAVNDE